MSKKVYRVRGKFLDNEGRCVVSFNHSMIPVAGLLPGELAEIELYRKRDETLGRIVSVVEKSSHRTENICPYSDKCGGCQLWHMDYESQLDFKQAQVETLLGSYGTVSKTIGMNEPQGYRHKIHATLGRDNRGQIISGIYEEKSHRLQSLKQCRIQDSVADDIMSTVREGMRKLKITPFDEDRRTGLLRHVLIKTGYKTDEIMIVFVLSSLKFPQGKTLTEMLLKKFPHIRTVVYNLNAKKTSMVLGEESKVVFGKGYIEDELCGVRFRISPKSFYQVNPEQTEKLYKKAIEMAHLKKTDNVLDTYCGIGTITLIAAPYVNQITGVELNPDAVADAQMNARMNKIKNADFVVQDSGKFMAAQPVDLGEENYYNVVIMDPPRSGSTEEFLKSLVCMAPERVIYISCNPVTQKRDLEILVKSGYKVKNIQPVDMFPMTSGIENIVLLKRAVMPSH